jgi:alpha-beta hydrolase superfamily lysophospholipase
MAAILIVLLFVVLFMVFLSTVLFIIGPAMLLQPHRRTIDYYRRVTTILHPSDLSLPYEELQLKTAEGIMLSCWLIPADTQPRGTVIFLHGVSECKIVGLPMAQRLHAAGFTVFLYDSRRHGDSGGNVCTYGFYEKLDVTTIINYLESRRDLTLGRIGLMGSSMGAAVAIQVAALDPRVAAVVAESGFASLRKVYDEYQKRMTKLPWHYLRNIVIKRSEQMAHFKASLVSPAEAVKQVHVPIFLLHGTADNKIPSSASEVVFRNANTPKELWLIPGARHNDMVEKGGKEYFDRIVRFFERTLQPSYNENQ